MIDYTSGDILKSDTEALVNTVNLDGYMGKGIAYQFKLEYPKNNEAYVHACKAKEIAIGKVFIFREKGKVIINFPTKNSWRANSKIEFIEKGLGSLISEIQIENIRSISVPPLGCGNGGLDWQEVRPLIEKYLLRLDASINVKIFEPSKYFVSKASSAPKMNLSHLVLMRLKKRLLRFNKLSLQKAAYFLNVYSNEEYFRFSEHKYGPYSHSIDILAKDIKEYQDHHGINTDRAIEISYQQLVSQKTNDKLDRFSDSIEKSTKIVNAISDESQLEIVATIVWIVKKKPGISVAQIIDSFRAWPKESQSRYSDLDIQEGLNKALEIQVLSHGLLGYELNPAINAGEQKIL